jgi:acetyl esterase
VPVDPELAALVDSANAGGSIDFRGLDPVDLRAMVKAAALAAGPGEAVSEVWDEATPDGVPVRIYRPTGPIVGLLVFFHGSGFVIYDIDTHDPECRALANRAGVVVVSVDYRLAPEHPFPAAVDDCLAATRWAIEHAERLGAPPRIAVGGDSAGGNLAAVVAQQMPDDIDFQLLVYPVTDQAEESASYAENGTGYLLSADHLRFFLDAYAADRLDPRASPLRAPSLAGAPPAFVLTAEYDPLRDEGEAYAAALAAAGVPVTAVRYDGAVHGFFQLSAFSQLACRAIDECAAGLAAAVRSKETT